MPGSTSNRSSPKDNIDARTRTLRVLLSLLTAEGLLSVLAGFAGRSMERRAFLFGYSLARLATGAALLVPVLALAGIIIWTFVRPARWSRILESLDNRLTARLKGLSALALGLLSVSLLGAFLLIMFGFSFAPIPIYQLQVAFERFTVAVAWLVSIPFQLCIVLLLVYSRILWPELAGGRITGQIVLFAIVTLTGIHWLTLAFRATWIYRIPGWYWTYSIPKRPQLSWAYLLLAGLVVAWAVRLVLRTPGRRVRNVLICIGLMYGLQVAFGFAQGQGFESIRLKYANSALSEEPQMACDTDFGTLAILRNYESTWGESFFLGTKPPGLAALYMGFRVLMAKLVPGSAGSMEACFEAVSQVFAYLFPLVASLAILLLFGLDKLAGPEQAGPGPALLFMTAPSVLLMPLLPDQFLFPVLFVLAAYVLGLAITKRSFGLSILAGVVLYLVLFFSFSLLPLIGLALAWVAIDLFVIERKGKSGLASALQIVLGICVGVAVVWVIAALALNYDPITRYVNAFHSHQAIKDFHWSLSTLIQYALLNNVEFAFWSGLPLVVLMGAGWIRSLVATLRGKGTRRDGFFIAFLLVFLAVNVIGQTRGEVGRIWIFLLPVGAMIASREASRLSRDPARGIVLVMALQLLTTCLAFLFLDFHT